MEFFFMQAERIGSPALGIILPAIIFALSVILTYLMIQHFVKKQDTNNPK